MRRRQILKGLAAVSLLPALPLTVRAARTRAAGLAQRIRPSDPAWPQAAQWAQLKQGGNYRRLRAVKAQYDPAGLFFGHNGVGSEDWSADGFTPANS